MTASNEELLRRRREAVPRGPFNVAPIFVERALGARLWDVEGNEYLDFCGGIGTLNVGHNHPRVVEAIRRQSEAYLHTCWHVAMYEPYLALCERLNELAPVPGPARTALFNSGAEAVENAVKIARAATGRPAVIAFERGFHGRTLLGMSLTGKVHPYKESFGPFAPEVYRLPWQPFFRPSEAAAGGEVGSACAAALDDLFHFQVPSGSVACLVVEPVLGEGGFHPLHPAAADCLARTCRERGILLVADEVQSGFGRCGALFACERYGLAPDLMTAAKSLAGGLPLSAVTGRAEVMDAPGVGGIGGTFAGNPLACAAALAVLDVMREEDLPRRAEAIGRQVLDAFRDLAAGHPNVAAPRGLGAMCALDVVDPGSGLPDPAGCGRVLAAARERGLLVMSASGNVLRTLMPLVIADEDLQRGLQILAEAVAAAAADAAAR